MKFLKISNIDISKYIKSSTITHESVWSSNSGRTLDGSFVGDIVAWKWKIQLSTIPLSQSDSALIQSLLKSSPFFSVSFIPTDTNEETFKTVQMYTSAPVSVVYSYNENLVRYENLSFNLVEQ